MKGVPSGPLIRLPPPTGVEPRVSTRPSDPRGEKGLAAAPLSPFAPAGRRCRQADEGAATTVLSFSYNSLPT